MGYKLRCPVCRGKFAWDVSKGYPEYCQIETCKEYIAPADDDAIVMPFISLKARKGPDTLFRQMEAGAEHRIEMASEQFGIPKADLSGLKMTDMRDGLREGDIAAPTVNNAITQHMAAMGTDGFGGPNGTPLNGAGLSPVVQSGLFPNAGAQMGKMVTSLHGSRTPHLRNENPSLETQQPGYRPRV